MQKGARFGSFTRQLVVLVLSAAVLQGLPGCDGQERQAVREQDTAALRRLAAEQQARKDSDQRGLVQQKCRDDLEAKKVEYKVATAARRHWDAASALRACSDILADPALRILVADAEIRSHVQDIDSPKTPARDKARALEMLSRDYPDKAKAHERRAAKLIAQAEQKERAAAAAARKREGVSVGMSPEEVVGSSWGKPERVNSTTSATGTREQWVYDGSGYLYFENGRLTTIQH